MELDTQGYSTCFIDEEMKSSYLDYAESVITERALPDIRDGLKPVHRRILHSMNESGCYFHKAHKKSARIVGDVLGKYHPHGENAIYDAVARMAQDFISNIPLIDGQGNFGSIDGDLPAAMRYTEVRLSNATRHLLTDIDKNTTNFVPNYDGTESEPEVLPARFPNILVNGSSGIAVGMATNIPPHNIGEIIDACCLYIENPDIPCERLLDVVHGPDFPTGGTIIGRNGIINAYNTGRGNIVIRGKTSIEDNSNGKKSIIITEIPYNVNKAKLIERIAELAREKQIDGISDLRDESNKDSMRVVIELKKDAIVDVILHQMYANTQLQSNFHVIMLAIVDNLPRVMNLKQIISEFISFREITIIRRTVCLLQHAQNRAHILIGIKIALDNIEDIIQIARDSANISYAQKLLTQKMWNIAKLIPIIQEINDHTKYDSNNNICNLTEIQAKAILDMRLGRLTHIEENKIDDELTQLTTQIVSYLEILKSRTKLLNILKEELTQIKTELATKRLTIIEHSDLEYEVSKNFVPKEDMVVTVTLNGYIKRVPLATYKSQKRGGKGRIGLSMRDEDITTQVFVGNTHTKMLFFSNIGQVYSLMLHTLPLSNPQSKGRPLVNILPLKTCESITNIVPMSGENDNNLSIIFATSNGNVRRNDLSDFEYIPSNGKIAIRLDEGDQLVSVKLCNANDHILLATKFGKAVRFLVENIRKVKSRTSNGIRGMKLNNGDCVVSMTILRGITLTTEERDAYLAIPLNTRLDIVMNHSIDITKHNVAHLSKEKVLNFAQNEEFLLTISENGFGKKSSAYEYRITNRGGSGVVNMDIAAKTGNVIAVVLVKVNEELILITDKGKLIRCSLNSIRSTKRNTSGVILFKTERDEKVVSVSLIIDNTLN